MAKNENTPVYDQTPAPVPDTSDAVAQAVAAAEERVRAEYEARLKEQAEQAEKDLAGAKQAAAEELQAAAAAAEEKAETKRQRDAAKAASAPRSFMVMQPFGITLGDEASTIVNFGPGEIIPAEYADHWYVQRQVGSGGVKETTPGLVTPGPEVVG